MSRRLRRSLALLVVVLLCLMAVRSRDMFLPALSHWLNVGEFPDCAEHVLILPGDETLRPLVGAALVNAGVARDVLIPETRVSADVKDGVSLPTTEVIRSVLMHRGIPEEKIVSLGGASRTTFDDARALQVYLEGKPADRVIVITNAFHTRRSRYIFRRVLGAEAERLRFVAAPNPGFADDDWWRHRSGLRIILSENFKLGFYLIRYADPRLWAVCGSLALGLLLIGWRQGKIRQAPG